MKDWVVRLFSSVLSALVGAGVAGWITYHVMTTNTRNQMVMSAYSSYLPEASAALILASEDVDRLTEDARIRLGAATAVLMIYASEEVLCRAFAFERRLTNKGNPGGGTEYLDLVAKIKEELTGKRIEGLESSEPCSFSIL